jgi:mannose-6-phosphate isomerase
MPAAFDSLADAAEWYEAWLRDAALPLWAGTGRDAERGSFLEALTPEGAPCDLPRRARVQTRQIWVFASAAAEGFGAGGLEIARRAYGVLRTRYRSEDGRFVRAADAAGAVVDATPLLYEQAFALLAMAALQRAGAGDHAAEAQALRAAIAPMRHAAGGFRETGAQPFQANAQMHLFEAALAWEAAGDVGWATLADELAELALTRFIDPDRGHVREFFDAAWRALPDEAGGLVEPGHQFEWAWLLETWARRRGTQALAPVVSALYAAGRRGVDPGHDVAINALWDDLTPRDLHARLWPQTEHLKAALLFGGEADALQAARGLARFIETPARGAWRDKMQADGSFVAEASPATSFYHLLGAILPLLRAAGRLKA